MIKIAIWESSPAKFLFSKLADSVAGVEYSLLTADHRSCHAKLESGEVDIALLPLLTVMQNIDDLELVPEICLASSGSYPYALLNGVSDLSTMTSIQFDPLHAQEVMMQKIVSQEHYALTPSFIPIANLSKVDTSVPRLIVNDPESASNTSLDLGREWFECAAYPSVWALLAMKKSSFTKLEIEPLKLALMKVNSDESRQAWADKVGTEVEKNFFRNDIRTRIDMEVQAGLDSMQSFFFAHGIIDDLPIYPFLKDQKESDMEKEEETSDTPD